MLALISGFCRMKRLGEVVLPLDGILANASQHFVRFFPCNLLRGLFMTVTITIVIWRSSLTLFCFFQVVHLHERHSES